MFWFAAFAAILSYGDIFGVFQNRLHPFWFSPSGSPRQRPVLQTFSSSYFAAMAAL